jgi:hypothetical protein
MTRFRSMKVFAAAAAVLVMAAGACAKDIVFTPPEDQAAPLFEVEYTNSAWGPAWTGFYVDGEGHVYSWDRSDAIDPALSGDELTPEQLAQKYARKKALVKSLTAAEVMQRYQQAADAAETGLTDPRGMCADAGNTRFSVWVHDAQDGNYHRILLHQRGDLAVTRRSNANRAVWKWLDAATRENPGETWCDPYANG